MNGVTTWAPRSRVAGTTGETRSALRPAAGPPTAPTKEPAMSRREAWIGVSRAPWRYLATRNTTASFARPRKSEANREGVTGDGDEREGRHGLGGPPLDEDEGEPDDAADELAHDRRVEGVGRELGHRPPHAAEAEPEGGHVGEVEAVADASRARAATEGREPPRPVPSRR